MTAHHVQVKRGTFGLCYVLHGMTADGKRVTRPIMADEYSRLLGRGLPVVREN